jgi:hypothetical protein
MLLDGSEPIRTNDQLQTLINEIAASPASFQETDWLEWKSGADYDLKDKGRRNEVAKFILGFANRNPDRAAINAEGRAFLIIGAQPGGIDGVRVYDTAHLTDWLRPFLGADGPVWTARYVEVEDKTVLVISVEPPRWGHPIFPLERPTGSQPEGAILVRHAGQTDYARPGDIRMLSRRAALGGDHLRVAVDWRDEPTSPAGIAFDSDDVRDWREREREFMVASGWDDAQLDEYVGQHDDGLVALLVSRAIRQGHGTLRLTLSNETEFFFAQVRVNVNFPWGLWMYASPQQADEETGFELRLPDRVHARLAPEYVDDHEPRARIDHDEPAGEIRTFMDPVDVPPHARVHLPRLYAAAVGTPAPPARSAQITWHATADNTHGMSSGYLTLAASAAPPLTTLDLMPER